MSILYPMYLTCKYESSASRSIAKTTLMVAVVMPKEDDLDLNDGNDDDVSMDDDHMFDQETMRRRELDDETGGACGVTWTKEGQWAALRQDYSEGDRVSVINDDLIIISIYSLATISYNVPQHRSSKETAAMTPAALNPGDQIW
jgi:hypothetical protein